MNRIKSISVLFMLSAILMFGCEKYPDGPPISFVPIADRVANDWKVGEVLKPVLKEVSK